MSATRPDHRRHHPPFLRDLSSPVSSSVRLPPISLRREIKASTPLPPHPLLSLDDLSHHSPSPQPPTPPQTTMTPSPLPGARRLRREWARTGSLRIGGPTRAAAPAVVVWARVAKPVAPLCCLRTSRGLKCRIQKDRRQNKQISRI